MSFAPVIRQATLADAPALAALAERTFIDTFGPDGFDLRYPAADLARFLAGSYSLDQVAGWIADPGGQVLVAVDVDGRLLAYVQSGDNTLPLAGAAVNDGELKRIYVDRIAQGTGLGRALLDHALDWLGSRPVLVGVWSLNLKAQRLYTRYGFEKVGAYHFMVGSTADEEFILRRGAG